MEDVLTQLTRQFLPQMTAAEKSRALIIAAEMLRRSRLRCYGVPRCAATR